MALNEAVRISMCVCVCVRPRALLFGPAAAAEVSGYVELPPAGVDPASRTRLEERKFFPTRFVGSQPHFRFRLETVAYFLLNVNEAAFFVGIFY